MSDNIGEFDVQIEAIKAKLIDPRSISKDHDPEGRSQQSANIWDIRTGRQSLRKDIQGQEDALQKESSGIRGLLDKVRGLISGPDATKSAQILARRETLKKEFDDMPEPRDVLNAYYERVSTTPLSVEEKKELLKPEVLAALTTEEYIALWRRLNPYYLAHVTRQGFRDHVAVMAHSGGRGVFSDGLVGIMKDGRMLRSPLGATGLRDLDEASVETVLMLQATYGKTYDIFSAQDEDQVRKIVDAILNYHNANAPKYPDKTAVHFSSNFPLDMYYGAEIGNEVFMIYPSDVLASQYTWGVNHSAMEDLTKTKDRDRIGVVRGMENDVFVWPGTLTNPGISIDAGIVFLPKDAMVDPETGSKYASRNETVEGKNVRERVDDQSIKERFDAFVADNGGQYFYATGGRDAYQAFCQVYSDDKMKEMGFHPEAILRFRDGMRIGRPIFDAFDSSQAVWKPAENPIPSQEYWEGYFQKNPDLRPRHIIYYEGTDSDWAVRRFMSAHKIGAADTSARDGVLLGFDDTYIGSATALSPNEREGVPWLGYDEVREALVQAGLKHLERKSQGFLLSD